MFKLAYERRKGTEHIIGGACLDLRSDDRLYQYVNNLGEMCLSDEFLSAMDINYEKKCEIVDANESLLFSSYGYKDIIKLMK